MRNLRGNLAILPIFGGVAIRELRWQTRSPRNQGAGGVSLVTQGEGVTHGILLASNVVTARGPR